MKSLTYYNINSSFTFENVSLQLTKFWTTESTNKYSKIWLTIIVCNKNNRSYRLINNLPFNTSDFSDVIVVLKQAFNTNILSNRKGTISNITFKFYFENKYNWNVFKNIFNKYVFKRIIFIIITTLLIIVTFVIYLEVSQLFNVIEIIDKEILEISKESIVSSDIYKENTHEKCTNKSLFNIFTNLFKVTNSSYEYYPNYFVPNEFENNNIYSSNNIISKQFSVLNKIVKSYAEYYNSNEALKYDLNTIRTEFSFYKKYCL